MSALTLAESGEAPESGLAFDNDLTGARGAVVETPVEGWQRRYRRLLFVTDAAVILVSAIAADKMRFGVTEHSIGGLSYLLLSVSLVPVWLAALALTRAYEPRYLGTGAEEFKRVGAASLRLMAAVAITAYTFKLQLARGYVAIALPLGTVLLLLGRYALRRWLHAGRRRGEYLHQVLAVGGAEGIEELGRQFAREPYAGFTLVGACIPDATATAGVDRLAGVPVLGSLTDVLAAVGRSGADTVAVASGPGMSSQVLRRMSWELEGSGVDLVVAPALTDVAGPRINVRPVAGLPLLHVDEPELAGARQVVKVVLEWVMATTAFVLAIVPLLVLAAAVRLDSPGAPLFKQTRVGKHGREFTVYKLRTMRADAESLLEALSGQNELAGSLLFKIRADPRITRMGRFLRRWSIDELPQLWNVVRGDMAVVGPRPPLPREVSQYGSDVARRLLVRPGITGLWQVSGRSDLNWEDSVRLDLYYVENWSLALDAMIIWKTLFAVAKGGGAY